MQRDHYFDNVKFLLVTLVVLGHMCFGPIMYRSHLFDALYSFIYLFHMPLFVFIAGYFSKNVQSDNYVKKIVTNVVIPYIFFEIAFTVFDYFIFEKKALVFRFFNPYYALWFLLSLAVWKFVLPHVIKFKYPLLFSALLAIIIGYDNDVGTFLSLSRTIVFLPFFLAGYYADGRLISKVKSRPAIIASCIVLLGVFLFIYQNYHSINKELLLGSDPYDQVNIKEWYAGGYRLLALSITAVVSLAVLAIVPKRKIFLISEFGMRTMYPFLFHGFLVKYLNKIEFQKAIDTPLEKILWILFCIAFTMVLSSKTFHRIVKGIVEPRFTWIFKDKQQTSTRSM